MPAASKEAPERSLAIRAAHQHLRRCAPALPTDQHYGIWLPGLLVLTCEVAVDAEEAK